MDRKEQISKEMASLGAELQEIQQKQISNLIKEAQDSGIDWLAQIAEAMLHEKFKAKPKTPKLGYVLADIYFKLKNDFCYPSNRTNKLNQKTLDLLDRITEEFDISDYVFCYTHYDECSDGHFFRRS